MQEEKAQHQRGEHDVGMKRASVDGSASKPEYSDIFVQLGEASLQASILSGYYLLPPQTKVATLWELVEGQYRTSWSLP